MRRAEETMIDELENQLALTESALDDLFAERLQDTTEYSKLKKELFILEQALQIVKSNIGE